jgi:hypothetical protein
MIPSMALVVAVEGECLSRGDFSIDETIHLGILDFIANCFRGLSLYPRREGLDAVTVGSTRSKPPSSLQVLTRDSTEKFHRASDEEGWLVLPSPMRRGTGASSAPTTTMSWPENTLTTLVMMIISPPTAALQLDTDLPFEQ